MRLDQLISGLDITCDTPGCDLTEIRVCDITEDSRTVVPGSLFIARSGSSDDGARYIEPAIECGCVAILTDRAHAAVIKLPARPKVVLLVTGDVRATTARLAERFYAEPASELVCAAVTGTNGKTTIAHLTQQLIEGAGVRCGLIGTVEIDDGRERARAAMTTPPALEVSRTLATMVEHECKAVVMEVSSHALDQARVGAVAFDAAAFTNLTGDHLDYHKTIDHYTRSKARLFAQLKPGALAVLNRDDPAHQAMMERCPAPTQIVHCSLESDADASVRIQEESIRGMRLTLETPQGRISAATPLFGAYNAMNILQSLLMAQRVLTVLGVSPEEQREAFEHALPELVLPQGRLEAAQGKDDDITVLVDFAHTDDALDSALGAVRRVLPQGAALWCVFGCGGDRDTTKRPRMGSVVARGADQIVITSDNPRTEPPSRIIDQILTGIDQGDRARVSVQPDRARAITHALLHAKAGDVVVIAGKGHETQQITPDGMGGVRVAQFDDREHAKIALRQRRLRAQPPKDAQQGAGAP